APEDGPASAGQPAAAAGVEADAAVDGDGGQERAGDLLDLVPARNREAGGAVVPGQVPDLRAGEGPVGGGAKARGQDASVAVDDGGDPHVDGAGDSPAALDGPEAADGQVLVVLGGAVEPAVVGNVEDEVGGGRAVPPAVG